MSKTPRTRTLAGVVAAAAAASVALSACTTGGTAVRSEYTGPERSQERSTSASGFAPGIDITVGEGDSAAVCTAGWIIESDNIASILTAGHCAPQGEGTPVTFGYAPKGSNVVLDREDFTVGEVLTTSYTEPYSPDNLDIAVVGLTQEVISDIFATPSIGGRINVEAPQADISSSVGNEVCWYSNASRLESSGAMPSCGTVTAVSKDQSKVLVEPRDNVEIDPQMAGAPATITNGKVGAAQRTFALGTFVGVYRDHAIIDNVYPFLEESGATIAGT